MDESSQEYPRDALGAPWDQVDSPEVAQPFDPWQAPGGDPCRPVAATRSQFTRNHDAPDFLPLDPFELQWTLIRSDLAVLEVPAAGFGRPSVYAGGGPSGEREGPAQRFASDNPPQWDGRNPQTQAEPYLK